MQLTAREAFLQFGHVLQSELFPHLEEALGPLSPELQLLTSVVSLVPLARLLNARRAATGRPAKDRTALATAFIAKAILNLPDTRHLIGRLRVDQALRQFCGWNSVRALPHESKFSRAFGEFSAGNLPQQLHAAVIEATQSGRLVGHIARDSTAIVGREHIPEAVMEKKRKDKLQKAKQQKAKKGKRGKRKGAHAKSKASERGPRMIGSRIKAWRRCWPRSRDIATWAERWIAMATTNPGVDTNCTGTSPMDRFRLAPY